MIAKNVLRIIECSLFMNKQHSLDEYRTIKYLQQVLRYQSDTIKFCTAGSPNRYSLYIK